MPLPSYLRAAMRVALLAGSANSCGPYVAPYDAGPDADYCAFAAVDEPCPSNGLTCALPTGSPDSYGLGYLRCEEPPLQNPRWVERRYTRGGPLAPPDLPA